MKLLPPAKHPPTQRRTTYRAIHETADYSVFVCRLNYDNYELSVHSLSDNETASISGAIGEDRNEGDLQLELVRRIHSAIDSLEIGKHEHPIREQVQFFAAEVASQITYWSNQI